MVDRGRLGLYFATYGAGIQPPEVLYDRAHSSFALDPTPHDAAAILKGATYLHITGITPALSSAAAKAALDLAHQAVEAGVTVSFDANYRATLWQSWGGDGPSVLLELLTMASIAFVDHRDLALLLDKQYRGVDSSEKNAIAFADAFAAFPRLEIIATTQREVVSMSHHNIAACGQARGAEIIFAPPISISKIIDRIGGGDAFAGALLVELSRKAQIGDALAVALTACAIKHGQCGDMIAITPESLRRAKTSPLADIQR
jgi:2-dehydro-3-deoxygluconokinase